MHLFTFSRLVAATAIFIASCAAYFSVLGISMLFSGSPIAAMVMAVSLELGKLVATSFLFRYWSSTKTFLKLYLTTSVFVLMFITSLGIFGYLTSSYQRSSLDDKLTSERILLMETKKSSLVKKVDLSKARISNINDLRASQERRLGESMTNTLIARNPIQLQELQAQTIELISKSEQNIDAENKKIDVTYGEIDDVNSSISQTKVSAMGRNDIITFKFVADESGIDMNKVVKWFIVIIITVFDPLAICLLLAYNTTQFDEKKKIIVNESSTTPSDQSRPNNIPEKELTIEHIRDTVTSKHRRHDCFSRLFKN